MKKLLSILVMALLVLTVVPLVFAEGDDTDGGIDVIIEEPDNEAPEIYQDATQRSWYPNDQTFYTADAYGGEDVNCYGDSVYTVEARGNYVFTGETVTYYVIVEDSDGDDTIDDVYINGFGACLEIPTSNYVCSTPWADYAAAKFGVTWNDATMNLYKCKLIVSSNYTQEKIIKIKAQDEKNCSVSEEKETLVFNPSLQVSLEGSINFGTVEVGETATSNAIKIRNVGTQGVVMDMYIASDDYFTAPGNQDAICGDGNGIKYDRFSYYATKGSLDSGENNNDYPGVGDNTGLCVANADEYTPMPSYAKGHMETMCRIINNQKKGSFLNQGDFMSLTLRLDIPENCEPYPYTEGEFHVMGLVI